MDIESKIWNYSNAGTKMHVFVDGVAMCRSSIRRDCPLMNVDYTTAKDREMCGACDKKFNAAVELTETETITETCNCPVLEYPYGKHLLNCPLLVSNENTGEGDYLPPADPQKVQRNCICEHAPMYHGARGCDQCTCGCARSDMDIKKNEETMTDTDCTCGPERTKLGPDANHYLECPQYPKVPKELVKAVALLRSSIHSLSTSIVEAFNALDNAGVFGAIDDATGYDIEPDLTVPVGKCDCTPTWVGHMPGCPRDPAEWGDMAFTTAQNGGSQ
jgi:hypothetical protein